MNLIAKNMNWIDKDPDNLNDQCVHGNVEFTIGNTKYVTLKDGLWNITVSGLYLLRTIEFDHTWENSVAEGNYLFPCCGSDIYPWPKSKFGFVCHGCPIGIHISVIHNNDLVEIGFSKEESEKINIGEWRELVSDYCRQVEDYYACSKPRADLENQEEREGWNLFWDEWKVRRDA